VNAILANSSERLSWSHGTNHNKASSVGILERRGRHSRAAAGHKAYHAVKCKSDCSSLTDDQLIARVQAGESSVFNVLVVRYQRRVQQLAITLMRNEYDAQEISQEGFFRAYLSIHRFRGESSFYTWLHRIVVNFAIDAKRHPLRQRLDWEAIAERVDDTRCLDLPRVANSDPFEAAFRTELKGGLNAALARLNSFHRAVIVMRELEGMSYQDMASTLHISKGTVMSRLFHARRRLQGFVAECANLSL
jgi:RNA polymerase sigma-70 factor, ECF subfamily